MYYAIIHVIDDDYNEYDTHVMIPATDWSHAINKIVNNFKNIDKITIECVQSDACDLVYLPEDCAQRVLEENYY